MSVLIETHRTECGSDLSPLSFETSGSETWPVWDRFLTLQGKRAYQVGNVCSTCQFFFERLEGANSSVDFGPERIERLASGLTSLDPGFIDDLSSMMPKAYYDISLLRLIPEAVSVGQEDDYFVTEQQRDWGADGFWGFPHHPKVPYYRVAPTDLGEGQSLFEFVVPMYPRNWLSAERLGSFDQALRNGRAPTAVALTLLDVKQHFDCDTAHWCLAHYLVDGHHKVEAASRAGQPVTLLSFLAIQHGVCGVDQVDRVIASLPR